MKRFLPHLVIFGLIAGIYQAGWLAPIDRLVTDLGFTAMPQPASGEVVVVEIDAKSLRQLDVWPWPRAYHAVLLDQLIAAGARRIAFDIDFSSRSTDAADQAFAQALKRTQGRAILPVLKQLAPAEDGSTEIVVAVPISELREHAQLAHVNILPSADDRVRQYLNLERFGEIAVPALASRLAGNPRPELQEFDIDYSIPPGSVPSLSYVDIMQGNFDRNAVAGKDIIIGATAIELGDRLAVPVHGVIAGPLLQALAYETLAQNRAMLRLADWPAMVVAFILAILVGPMLSALMWRNGLAVLALSWAMLTAASFAAQNELALLVDIAPGLLITLTSYGYAVVRRIDRQAVSIYRERMLSLHRRAMMSTVVESSFDGIVITDEAGLVQMSNAAAIAMMGWDDVEIVGQNVDDYIPRPEIADDGSESSEDTPVHTRKLEATRGDGTTFTMEIVINTSRVAMASGGTKSERTDETVRIFTFRDVTARKLAEQARQHAMEEAVAANKAKTEFLANMSHELRTPLNGIIGLADVMRTEALGPLGSAEYTEFVGDIYDSGHHLLEIVEDILNMSKIEAGEMTLNESEFDLADAVDASIRIVRELAGKKNLALATELTPGLPRVNADERMIKQILLNLLSNAVKFTPEDGKVSVRASRREDGGITIEVADTGIGIPAGDIERALEPFAQVDSRLQREFEGTGLGLPLVKSMSELHDGRLIIESVVDQGTTVRVELPAERSRGHQELESKVPGDNENGESASADAEAGDEHDRGEPVHLGAEPKDLDAAA